MCVFVLYCYRYALTVATEKSPRYKLLLACKFIHVGVPRDMENYFRISSTERGLENNDVRYLLCQI